MLHPLASLWRHSSRVTFYESGGQVGQALMHGNGVHAPGARRRFVSSEEAFQYLRYWLAEPAARAELRWVLQRSGPSLATSQAGADGWLHALAGRLVSGAIVVVEEMSRQAMPGRLVAPPATAAAVAALAKLPALASMPAIAVPLNLLPVLEDIRIEGAEVLPELNQSLAQVKATIATIGSASLSLDPAPSKVAAIRTALATATSKTTTTLGEL